MKKLRGNRGEARNKYFFKIDGCHLHARAANAMQQECNCNFGSRFLNFHTSVTQCYEDAHKIFFFADELAATRFDDGKDWPFPSTSALPLLVIPSYVTLSFNSRLRMCSSASLPSLAASQPSVCCALCSALLSLCVLLRSLPLPLCSSPSSAACQLSFQSLNFGRLSGPQLPDYLSPRTADYIAIAITQLSNTTNFIQLRLLQIFLS